jgi:hypothetical protein
LTPSWPEIFENDAHRRHDMSAAVANMTACATPIRAWATTSCLFRRYPSRHAPTSSSITRGPGRR